MKFVAVLQARMGSRRLPGKVLAEVAGAPLLAMVCSRVGRAQQLSELIVATSRAPEDDAIAAFCEAHGLRCVRGDQHDVLDRYFLAAHASGADAIVRLTADCPFLDAGVIDDVVAAHRESGADFTTNTLERTYPDGLDVEVFSRHALERSWSETTMMSEREHVTPYIRRSGHFSHHNVAQAEDHSKHRWVVDEPEDLEFVRAVVGALGDRDDFETHELLQLLRDRPELMEINRKHKLNEGYQHDLAKDRPRPRPGPDSSGARRYEEAKRIIPGGTQLLSKRPEMHLPGSWPAYYHRARGVDVWDLDGNHYVDMAVNGLGATILGAADPEVDEAVREAISCGVASLLNSPEEVELAELLCELHPWAEMARFTRSGGEAMAVAVRLARAHTGRDRVAFCGYHGWHDWYLAANLADEHSLDGHLLPGLDPAGVPRGLKGTALPFRYNQLNELDAILDAHPGEVAAIVMEPQRGSEPAAGFLEGVRTRASEHGAALVLDEITAGFRMGPGGRHLDLGVTPDLAVYAKGLGNGYAVAAVIGTGSWMQAAQGSFISSTHWTERVGSVAALATLRKHRREKVHEHLIAIGEAVQRGWATQAEAAGLEITVGGLPPLAHFGVVGEDAQVARTFFVQEMLRRGFLAGTGFYATYAHTPAHVEHYLDQAGRVFAEIVEAREAGDLEARLAGPVAHTGFARLT